METGAKLNMRDVDQVHWWFVSRRRILAAVIARVAGHSPVEVAEVGCGAGGNLEMLSRLGPLHASEIDPALREEAIRRSGIVVQGGALPDGLPFERNRFGLVAALDVVEHVDADAASVAAMASLLAPGGHLVVTVPAYRWLWSAHDDTHEHKRRYTAREVEGLMRSAGLEVVRSTYFNTLLFPAIALARLLGKALGRSSTNDAALPHPSVNAILAAIFGVERWVLPFISLPFGVSVLCIGRKPMSAGCAP